MHVFIYPSYKLAPDTTIEKYITAGSIGQRIIDSEGIAITVGFRPSSDYGVKSANLVFIIG
jgi:hypothetical protein